MVDDSGVVIDYLSRAHDIYSAGYLGGYFVFFEE